MTDNNNYMLHLYMMYLHCIHIYTVFKEGLHM